ncbi:hypothetical protein [Amycolatopsis sp. FDAARGOS 1241]|uniref:hypothetical protein n=1 Tax=Amycolatopsis sp. FDAARGOS 1241 TaxID=2778070 RepID=UPI00194E1E4E|nr:hypothetical protein [Amycolatopsis sp. FDAARGOS 1241]QRP43299.1 hypothetical protein I6J71_28240 [Amycolatopsis sp. FDAARGOS 1241]
MDLAELLDRSGLAVLDHLERQAAVPVLDGLQAQGDLLVIPWALVARTVRISDYAYWAPVPPGGAELVRGAAGRNPHTLVADPGTCRWTTAVRDPLVLGIAAFENTAPVYLIHPEHGGSGVAPGSWLVRRQQEGETGRPRRLIAD